MTTTKDVEAVAGAIDPDAWDERYLPHIYALRAHRREASIQTAVVAIKAHTEILMEPSEEMIEAGAGIIGYYIPRTELITAFQAMLSAQEKTDG